jgi:hypothetical protein
MFFYNRLIDIVTEIAALSGTYAVDGIDIFGYSVGLNSQGNVAIIGAKNDEIPGSGADSGVAYVFRSNNDIWFQETILTGTLASGSNDFFGSSVAINKVGDLIVVGADNDQAFANPAGSGLAYIYRSGSSGWIQEGILSGSQTSALSGTLDTFGWTVKLNYVGNILFVSAPRDEAPGNPATTGILYVFKSGSSGWYEETYLTGSYAKQSSDAIGLWNPNIFKDTLGTNEFGNICVIGGPTDELPSNALSSGVAYVFRSGSSGWYEEQVLSGAYATGSNDVFGIATDMNKTGDLIAIGAPGDEYPSNPGGMGLVYIFRSGSSGWYNEQIINGTLAKETSDIFGSSVALSENGKILFVGAYQDEFSGTGSYGLTYMFRSGSDGWKQTNVFSGSQTRASEFNENFGGSLAINSNADRLLVGAWGDEAPGTSGSSGLVYSFKIT